MDCPSCKKLMQWNRRTVEVDSQDYQDSRTVEVEVYYCFDCEEAVVKEAW